MLKTLAPEYNIYLVTICLNESMMIIGSGSGLTDTFHKYVIAQNYNETESIIIENFGNKFDIQMIDIYQVNKRLVSLNKISSYLTSVERDVLFND